MLLLSSAVGLLRPRLFVPPLFFADHDCIGRSTVLLRLATRSINQILSSSDLHHRPLHLLLSARTSPVPRSSTEDMRACSSTSVSTLTTTSWLTWTLYISSSKCSINSSEMFANWI